MPAEAEGPGAPGVPGASGASRRRRYVLWAIAGVAVVAAGLVGVLASRGPATATPGPCALCGEAAPPVVGSSIDGVAMSPAALQGRFVVVSFFASWCGPCRLDEPQLQAFAREHRASGDATLLGVVFDDDPTSAGRYLSAAGASWPAVGDPGGRIALDYGVANPAETYLVAPNRLVVAKFFGPVRTRQLDQAMARARADGAG